MKHGEANVPGWWQQVEKSKCKNNAAEPESKYQRAYSESAWLRAYDLITQERRALHGKAHGEANKAHGRVGGPEPTYSLTYRGVLLFACSRRSHDVARY